MKNEYSKMLFMDLEQWRKKTRTTKREMSFLMGVSYTAYQNWSNKGATPHHQYIERMKNLNTFFDRNWESYRKKNEQLWSDSVRERIKNNPRLKRKETNEDKKS